MSASAGASLGVTVSAETTQFQRALGTASNAAERFSKLFKGLFNQGGGKSIAAPITAMSKEMEAATRRTERLHRELKGLNDTLTSIQQKKIGASGDALKDLQRQEKYATRRVGQASVRAEAADRALQGIAPGPAPEAKPERERDTGGSNAPVNFIESFAGGMLGPWAKLATAAGAGALLAHAVKSGINNAEGVTDLSGRAGGSEDDYKRLRQKASALGFTPDQALGMAGGMSLGGDTMRRGLTGDTLAAGSFARMFGLDGGSVASGMGQAGKLGGFNPGDARKFAEMMANAIHKVGMDPRAEEMQQATLMLMNRQLATNPSADPGTAMALQTLLNKTGIPALQGANGANALSRMQSMVTGSMDDPHQAFFQAAMRQSGLAHGFYDMMSLKEKGVLGDSRVFPAMARFAMRNAPSRDAGLYALSDNTGLSFNTLRAWDKKAGGIEHTSLAGIKHMLATPGALHAGAAAQLAKSGNDVRRGIASFENVTLDASQPIVKGVATLGNWASQEYKTLTDILATNKETGQAIDRLTEHALGLKPGSFHAGETTERAASKYGKKVLSGLETGETGGRMPDSSGMVFDRKTGRWKNKNGAPAFDIGPPGGAFGVPVLPPSTPRGHLPGGGPPVQRGSVDIHIHEHGVVSHSSKLALHAAIGEVLRDHGHIHATTHPNSSYRRV